MTLATWITLSRLLAVPILLYLLRWDATEPTAVSARWIAVAVFVIAAGTDWLDGYVARRFNQVSDLGKFLDPLVDKLLILVPLLALIELRVVPAWSVAVILVRELAIAGWRVNQPKISGANWWGKIKTVVQIVALALLIAPLSGLWTAVGLGVYGLAIALTIISGVIYLKDA
ncbi:CDP-diacylglycerol--glycerol-3-phosphate 3-phosphatidyltransferase [Lyngbya confervoides]|uniref:CDP-diacylglycerol--glycerol-3-phosphate 3-phosphatidyltransferase n=1 Tax=Lyngbya confervoides BDU141951 TaxID=1574623 RepID=A0ABD4SXP1_9CYAN|nr:CDP-diacylglycerol--glycerol-3-phosphate 3-phosphatidyltransferase [Lyngbya confervoides]MCM1981324.1 CDP-diacylglycerol--glycerol-3-phosphate 3-phosphatidyltransferase [Lyngbya confervoides BDU141951]